jgi:acetolactate synthase-1/2/3 large subunit
VSKSVENTDKENNKKSLPRRDFFKGAAVGAAALVAKPGVANAETARAVPARPSVLPPTEAQAQAEVGSPGPAVVSQPGRVHASDFMVDVFRSLDLEFAAINPGSSFEGIHESMINHGGNTMPQILTCLHEEAAATMAHGYAKAAGKPMMAMFHGTVGLLHAGMGIFQCWARSGSLSGRAQPEPHKCRQPAA